MYNINFFRINFSIKYFTDTVNSRYFFISINLNISVYYRRLNIINLKKLSENLNFILIICYFELRSNHFFSNRVSKFMCSYIEILICSLKKFHQYLFIKMPFRLEIFFVSSTLNSELFCSERTSISFSAYPNSPISFLYKMSNSVLAL